MVIRRLSYLLDREPDTGSLRLQPLRPPGRTAAESSRAEGETPHELLAQVEQVIALTHRGRRTESSAAAGSRPAAVSW